MSYGQSNIVHERPNYEGSLVVRGDQTEYDPRDVELRRFESADIRRSPERRSPAKIANPTHSHNKKYPATNRVAP